MLDLLAISFFCFYEEKFSQTNTKRCGYCRSSSFGGYKSLFWFEFDQRTLIQGPTLRKVGPCIEWDIRLHFKHDQTAIC